MCWSFFCYVLLCVLSSFAIILTRKRERELIAFALIVFPMSCDRLCSVAFSHGVVGWSAMCVFVVFPDHTHSLFALLLFSPDENCFGITVLGNVSPSVIADAMQMQYRQSLHCSHMLGMYIDEVTCHARISKCLSEGVQLNFDNDFF